MMRYKSILIFIVFILFSLNFIFAEENIKQPNVAGSFYPKHAKALQNQINGFLSQILAEKIEGEILAMISPHAGYEYSGAVAAYGYKAIKELKYTTVIVIAPSHYVDFKGSSIWLSGAFKTPLGEIPVDSQLGAKIVAENKNIRFLPQAFSKEHSLEVQLPFLQTVFKNIKIVPIVMGKPNFEDCGLLAKAIAKAIGERDDVLVIASSDMSHFHVFQEANAIDKKTLKLLENFDLKGLWDKGINGEIELCGLSSVITALLYSKEREANEIKILKYANSGDVTGDFSRVVGYTSALIYKKTSEKGDKAMLNDVQKQKLLEIARESLENYIKFGKRVNFSSADSQLNQERGAFVTLTEKGELRGCIGRIVADMPLYLVISQMAIEASTSDPRFYAVKAEELKDLEIEISVLSPIEKIDDINKIEVGIHGLIIRKGFSSGLLLPQVAQEYGWDRLTFLEQTCRKAGLPQDAWKTGAEISIFSAEVFSEKSIH
ncbi:MAG: AmmeMemoRadiSam system protein B [Candidatus Omnitrophota bacterium]|nr:AmmeMemoRadiSam system protein B [Candidatus Omnitrophota bacterium]